MGLFGPSFMKVWQQGTPAEGKIVGIRRSTVSEDESTYEVEDYAVDLGGELLGIRQKLSPRQEVRLGMPVTVHRQGKAAVIRWGAPVENRWKTVKPPASGIEDKVDGPPRGGWASGQAEILDLGTRAGMLGLTTVTQAKVRFNDGTEALIDKYAPPFYASHLGGKGTTLPALQHPRDARKIRIDWPAAAVASPGVGVAPIAGGIESSTGSGSAMSAGEPNTHPGFGKKGLLDRMQDKVAATTGGMMGFDMNAGPAAEDPVSWETFIAATVAIRDDPTTPADEVAQRHGIPAGEWAAVNKRWMGRIMTDWKLGAAYGEALS
ncbi:hypothetical protein [Pseudolysinimonas yzui]|nr:hypothetical protein [Pseudolysinimonas yzui]